MKINIISTCNSALEYLYISSFFRLFGITVYNRLYSLNYNLSTQNNNSTENIRSDVFTILISDDVFKTYRNYQVLASISDVVISGLSDTQKSGGIKFPDKYNDTKSKTSYAFLRRIVIEIIRKFGQAATIYFKDASDMIKFYLETDLLNTWYLSSHVIKSENFIYNKINELGEKVDILSEHYYDSESPNFIFAIGRLKYIINKLCNSLKIINKIEWSELFEIGLDLFMADKSKFRYNISMGYIYDLSKTNNMTAERYYLECIDDDDYCVRYALARLYEFRMNDKNRAKSYLKEVIQRNKMYYKAYYRLAMYAEEDNSMSKALSSYQNVLKIISERISLNCWQVNDIIYFIMSCGKIMGRRTCGSNGVSDYYNRMAISTLDYIDTNRFFVALTNFLYDEDNERNKMLNFIRDDVRQNAEQHIDKFCI